MGLFYILRRNTNLLKEAQEVFGDIVIDAWDANCDFSYTSPSQVEKSLNDAANISRLNIGSAFDIGQQNIVLGLANGRMITFKVSDWTEVRPLNSKDVIFESEASAPKSGPARILTGWKKENIGIGLNYYRPQFREEII